MVNASVSKSHRVAGLLAAASAGALMMWTPAFAAESSSSAVEEVVVTASKRTEKLKDVPGAVSALSEKKLDKLGVTNFADYSTLVPGLSTTGGASNGFGTVIIRGMYTGAQQITNTSATYIGDTPFTASGSLSAAALITIDPDLVDVQRVEVLKGPQGTLYGASSLGGLIRIIPKDVSLGSYSGNIRASVSSVNDGGTGYGLKGYANLPFVSDRFGVAIGAFTRKDAGFATNVFTGHDEMGEVKSTGGSISARLQPVEGLNLTARYLTQRQESVGAAGQENFLGTNTPVYGERKYSAINDAPGEAKYDNYEGKAEWSTDLGALTGVISKGKYDTFNNFDYTKSYGNYIRLLLGVNGPFFFPNGYQVPGRLNVKGDKDNQEIRFASKRLGPIEFLVGAYHTEEDTHYIGAIVGKKADGTPLLAPFNNIATFDIHGFYKETAFYGNITYYVTDALDFTIGARATKNETTAMNTRSGFLYGLANPATQQLQNAKDDSTLWLATARWRPTENVSTYLRAATGYRPGGPQTNINPPPGAPKFYDPDKVTNYEAGVKGYGFDRRLSFDVSVYHVDWKDIQLNGLYNGVVLTGNGGTAKINGIEGAADYDFRNGLTVGGNFGYNRTKLTQVEGVTATAIGAVTGDELPGGPRWTGAAYADYSWGLSDGVTATVGATVRYQGTKQSTYSVVTGSSVPHTVPDYATADLRAGVNWNRYALEARVNNVTDVNGYNGYSTARLYVGQPVSSSASLIRPRTFVLQVSARF